MDDKHVRRASSEDTGDILAIQQAALPESLLTLSGPSYLQRAFYPIALNHPRARSYVLTVNGNVSGFAFYGNSPGFFRRKLSERKLELMLAIVSRFPQSPGLVLKYLQVARESKIVLNRDPGESLFHLFLIAIAPYNQGKGLGSVLLNNSLRLAASEFGRKQCLLEAKTPQALGFYKRNGFEEVGYETRGPIRFIEMIRQLD
jgi:ribosomal protein S18 acetylase RimI-like enzyme